MTNEPDDRRELLGAYSLDAVDDVERARVERLLAEDAAARREVARYEDAAAALVTDDIAVEPPTDAWAGIAQRIADNPRPIATRRPRRARVWFAAAAAVLVVALGGTLAITQLGNGPSAATQLEKALRDPQAGTGAFATAGGEARVAVRPDGRGYLDARSLVALPAGKVYQLWSLDAATPVSLGVLRAHDGIATFEAAPTSHTLGLSVEQAPGAGQPTLPTVVTATLT